MEALIKPSSYFDNEIFNKEKTNIFNIDWYYVGTEDEFTEENSFKTFNLGDIPIVVQKTRGEIKAFKNICSHRHSIIQTEKEGIRPLMCPYHGWAYDKNGIPKGIPKKPLFKISKDELKCLKLRSYDIDKCGKLLFVKVNSSNQTSLKDFLGQFYEELKKASIQFNKKIDTNRIEINANWKVLVENTLESYHVALVHADTFQRLGASGLNFIYDKNHSKWEANLAQKEDEGKQSKINKYFSERNYKINGYDHILIFPNLLFSTTYGISFNLSTVEPLGPNKSLFTSYVFLSKASTNSSIIDLYENSLKKFNRDVFEEDKTVCEGVQKGVHYSHFRGELSDEELRVLSFQKNYLTKMNQIL